MTYNEITSNSVRVGARILNTFIDALEWDDAIEKVLSWGDGRQSRTVCLFNVHSSVTALDNPDLAKALNSSDMVLPDGAPIAWLLRRNGFKKQSRIAGPDLMLRLCDALQDSSITVFLFGSSEETLLDLRKSLEVQFPRLTVSGTLSPRYGEWTQKEESKYTDTINQSGAGIILVGLGCPKQEIWMANHKNVIHGVLLGVGAAFDFHAGVIQRAPIFIQKAGLEWLHRLLSEPKRLWRRYLITNTRFIWLALIDMKKYYSKNNNA